MLWDFVPERFRSPHCIGSTLRRWQQAEELKKDTKRAASDPISFLDGYSNRSAEALDTWKILSGLGEKFKRGDGLRAGEKSPFGRQEQGEWPSAIPVANCITDRRQRQ